ECPAGCGMIIKSRESRAVKAEGNQNDPIGSGRLCARGQSVLQGHYDPNRLKMALKKIGDGNRVPISYRDAISEIGEKLHEQEHRIIILSRIETGALSEIFDSFCSLGSKNSKVLYFEPIDYEFLKDACNELFGISIVPHFDLSKSDFILSFGAEFLGSWISPMEFARQFASVHDYKDGSIESRFVFIGPALTQTAANADIYIQLNPHQMQALAVSIIKIIVEQKMTKRDPSVLISALSHIDTEEIINATGLDRIRVLKLAKRFAVAKSPVALPAEDRILALSAMILNYLSANIDETINFDQSHALSGTEYHRELASLSQNLTKNDVVIIQNANLKYVMGKNFSLDMAGLVIYMGYVLDETAEKADYILPIYSPLESWGEYSAYKGNFSIMQPTTALLYPQGTMAAGDILIEIAKASSKDLKRKTLKIENFESWLKERYRDIHFEQGGRLHFEDFWKNILSNGGLWDNAISSEKMKKNDLNLFAPKTKLFKFGKESSVKTSTMTLWIVPHIMMFDGRFSSRGWLLETPDPISGLMWGNGAMVHPLTAEKLGMKFEDKIKLRTDTGELTTKLIRLKTDSGELTVPIFITYDTAPDTISIASGFGSASSVGVNAFVLGKIGQKAVDISLSDGETGSLILAYTSDDQQERELLKWIKINDFTGKTREVEEITLPLPEGYDKKKDIFTSHHHKKYRWAMVVDLQRCIGCGSCSVACYAENNIPVKGKYESIRRHTMAWLRIPPYRQRKGSHNVGFLPMVCQQCDSAPCESVCPVYASAHNEEGLNMQVYNRCIGTRYCANNCPYKVRRFNWSDSSIMKPLDQQLNPEVSVRGRGVMEKCTFCIQRIREGEQKARLQKRELLDGEIQPACVQTCPTSALSFGNLMDAKSRVRKLFLDDQRRYQLLRELGTKPSVIYLKRVDASDDTI
ncbi:MAG: 4Fe-4S dicluster domain-containing protein, partial [Oligoflexales bacterium]|nr:4Fe-4S dicluster domain-containing protein [Oligoflexales bacterium]